LKCANCHGSDGKLGFSNAADLSKTTIGTDSIKQVILKGRNAMVPVDLTEEQAAAVTAYVESSLKGK
jgi:mono/diheme cytochrome c family protein